MDQPMDVDDPMGDDEPMEVDDPASEEEIDEVVDQNPDGSNSWTAFYPDQKVGAGKRPLFWKLVASVSNILPQTMAAYEKFLRVDATYFRIDNHDFDTYFKKENPGLTSMYLSLDFWNSIPPATTKPNSEKGSPSGPTIPARDKNGTPILANRKALRKSVSQSGSVNDRAGFEDRGKWNFIFSGSFPSITTSKKGFARSINPVIDVTLVLVNTQHFSEDDFAHALTAIASKHQQKVHIKKKGDIPTIENENKLLSRSPYNDFEVWIPNAVWQSYFKARPQRQLPTKDTLVKASQLKINPVTPENKNQTSVAASNSARAQQRAIAQRQGTSTTANTGDPKSYSLSAYQIGAKKPRDGQKGQLSVMGYSATTAAEIFGWITPRKQIATVTDGPISWAGNSLWPSEWTHKVGYAYGLSPSIAQSPGNLIFGTSETNSLMTRFENAIQQFLKREAEFLATPPTTLKARDAQTAARGQLAIEQITQNIVQRSATTFQDVKWDPHTLNGGIAQAPFWLWYGLTYNFRPSANSGQSSLTAPIGSLETSFYTFERPFLLFLETKLDEELRSVLFAKRRQQANKQPPHTMKAIQRRTAFVRQTGNANDAFNFNTLTSVLLSVGQDAPATANNTLLSGVAASTAPQNMPHAELWSEAIAGNPVTVAGMSLERPSLLSVNDNGQLVEIPAATIASSADELHMRQIPTAEAPRGTAQNTIRQNTINPFGTMGGIRQLSVMHQTATPAAGTPPGFVLTGDIQLFGSVAAKLYTYHGTAVGDEIQELVTVPTNVSLGRLFSGLIGDEFKSIGIQNIQLKYFDHTTAEGKPPGLWFDADFQFVGALQPIGDILGSIFKQSHPTMHMESLVAKNRDWGTLLDLPTGFSVMGTFAGISTTLGDLEITSVGVRIIIDERIDTVPKYRTFHQLSYDFFGAGHLHVPGSVTPLDVNFSLSKAGTLISLSMTVQKNIWENVFGIAGLNLQEVLFTASFDETHIADSIIFDLSAMMQKGDEFVRLEGYFMKGDWSLNAEIDELDLGSISQMFGSVLGGSLPVFDYDVEFDTLSLQIDPTGITLMGAMTIDQFSTAEASIEIGLAGMHITGSIGNVTMDEVTIKQASFEIVIAPPGKSKKPIIFGVNGVVDFGGLEISSTLYIDKQPGKELLWTVYGEYNVPISSAGLAPNLKGTFLDLPMSQIALIAGNSNQPADGFINKYNYPIIKGIQLCAAIKSIDALNRITRVNMDGLILRVGLVAGVGLSFGVVLPMDKAISFGPNITSGPISVSLEISKPPSLIISAGLNLVVAKQTSPLVFTMSLAANVIDASATAQMTGYWVNPFGVSQNIKIGPNMALELGITYATFFTTGTPSKLAINGGLAIGKTEAQVALSLGNNPSQELISASLANLSLADMVAFASTITRDTIPTPDNSILHFEQVSMYISTGVSIGVTTYPAGASFSGSMQLFGKKATMSASINKGIQISGSFEGFKLGPLAIKGATTPNAQVQLEIAKTKQHLLIDGGTSLLTTAASIHLEATLLPKPLFDFVLTLAFTELLPFKITGKMIGVFSSTEALDFQLDALLEQKILDYLISQANMQLVTAQKAAKEGFVNTQKQLDQAEASFQASVTRAKGDLAKAQAAWTAKSTAAQHNIDQVVQSTKDGQKKLQADLQTATVSYSAKVDAAQRSLDQTTATSAAAIKSAQENVAKVTADSNAKIDAARKQVVDAQTSMNSKFGDALKSIQSAKDSVQNAQNDLNAATQNTAKAQSDLDHASFLQKAKMAAQLAAAKTVETSKRTALATAQGSLTAAMAVINGTGYQAAQATLQAYQASLKSTEDASPRLASAAQATLQATINAQNSAVNSAKAALDQTKTASNEALAMKAATAALNGFNKTQDQLLQTAKAALTALQSSAEFIAFTETQKALDFANSNTKDLDIARHALAAAQASENGALAATAWMVNHAGNFFNLTSIELSGTLKGLCDHGEPMKAHIVGMVADKKVDVVLDYNIGKTPDLIKSLFEHFWGILTGTNPTTTLPIRGSLCASTVPGHMEKDMDSIKSLGTRAFSHQRLDTTTEQIRLFQIMPRERDSDPIRGILQKFDIQSLPPFIALSYTWGPEHPKQFISIDESSFEICQNLWCFLSVYEALNQGDSRYHIPNGLECGALKTSFLWIDQICIDQSQVAERSHQVHLMGEIYRRAKEVIDWIPDVSDALKRLRTGGVGIPPPSYFYIQKLFRAPYWTGVWVQQEVMLARQLIIMSPADSGTWLVLWEEIALAVSSQPPRENSLQSFDPLRMPMEHDPPILKALLQHRASSMLRDGFHLHEALSKFDICVCSDPTDHVYGLLGIVRPKERIRIDYNLNIEEIWRSAFTMVVQSQEEDPDNELIDFLALKINLHSHLDHDTIQKFVKSLQSQQLSHATTARSQRSGNENLVPRVMIFKN